MDIIFDNENAKEERDGVSGIVVLTLKSLMRIMKDTFSAYVMLGMTMPRVPSTYVRVRVCCRA